MTFPLAPIPLAAAGAALLVLLYVWLLRRRKKLALRYASLSIVKEAMGKGPGIRRHIPPVLFLLALAAMLLAAARPLAVVTLPSQPGDHHPGHGRLGQHARHRRQAQPAGGVAGRGQGVSGRTAAQRAVGIVAFAGTAQVVQPPTLSREDLVAAIDKFQMQRATAIGSAIVIAGRAVPRPGHRPDSRWPAQRPPARHPIDAAPKEKKEFTPVAPGSYTRRPSSC
jgi:Ca-activated chloride channel family protein